jgi:lipoprotein-releasing system permease protein
MVICLRRSPQLFKPLPLFLGLRYFSSSGGASSGSSRLVSFISTLAISGLVLGVGLLVVVLSVMNGFDRELRERILSVVPHVQIIHNYGVDNWQQQAAVIQAQPSVVEVSPYNEVNGLINFRRDSRPIQLLGLASEALPSGIAKVFEEGGVALPELGQVLISEVVANNLNIQLGRRVTIIIPAATGPTKAVSLVVSGLFSTHTEVDQLLAIASLEQVADINNAPNLVKGFRVQIDDQFNARQLGYQLLDKLPYGYGFRDWFQTHGNLYQAIQLSRNMVGLLIFMIIAIAAFNVISMLMMSVIDKRRDIAILQTLGLARPDILRLFLIQGAFIGLFGISIGVALGVLGSIWVADLVSCMESLLGVTFLNTEVYPIDYIPVDLRWSDVMMVAGSALALNLLATLYPALRASRMVPAQELRYE